MNKSPFLTDTNKTEKKVPGSFFGVPGRDIEMEDIAGK